LAVRTGGTVRYLANDHLGSTAFVMNSGGVLESHVRYYPYGMTWSQSATPATDRLFTGHQQMGAKSGTYYANARFYSADIGRFPQPDSVMARPFDPQALSRYTYG
jgi:RHS repeat-associated protein